MAAHSWVIVGTGPNRIIVDAARQAIPTDLAALFSERERVSGAIYESTAAQLRVRLRLLGVDEVLTTRIVEAMWPDRVNVIGELSDSGPGELMNAWLDHFGEEEDYGRPNEWAETLQAQWGTLWGESRRQFRYFLDRVPAEMPVVLDLSEPVDRGYVPNSTFADDARNFLANEASGAMPTIVLTEGSTDAEALVAAMELVRPGLVGFMTFLNYGLKPDGGVGAVTNGMKALAAAGVANRVIGLIDNDTAGAEGRRALAGIQLPDRIKGATLPVLEIAAAYPTLGPNGPEVANVNGRAVSIEFFLGDDVLRDAGGSLEPIQWTRYVDSIGEYQGEFLNKRRIQERFRTKVSEARAGRMVETEWTNLAELLDHIAEL